MATVDDGEGESARRRLPEVVACPVCGKQPDVDVVAPWPREHGPAPWYAVCYGQTPYEHCVGVNGSDHRDVIENWNREADSKGRTK